MIPRQTLTVTRPDPTSDYANGVWVEGPSPTVFTIEASVQPARGDARSNVPEGYDKTSAYLLYTDTELICAEAEGNQSDRVTLFGATYDVVNVEPWQNEIIEHYAVTVALKD
jgi:hypothetical protein